MHTTIPSSSPTLADLKQVMIRIQIAALETLERCMQNLELTGDDKKDRAAATALNRQRMSATQTLLHCRTMFRELREAELQEHRIAQEKKQAEKKARREEIKKEEAAKKAAAEKAAKEAAAAEAKAAEEAAAAEGAAEE